MPGVRRVARHGRPSADFCSETCGTAWRDAQAAQPVDQGRHRTTRCPRSLPERPLTWLAPAPVAEAWSRRARRCGGVRVAVLRVPERALRADRGLVVRPHPHRLTGSTSRRGSSWIPPSRVGQDTRPGGRPSTWCQARDDDQHHPGGGLPALVEGRSRLLFDEIDAVFNPKTGGNNEDLRALLNAGYKRAATVARCVGDAKSMNVTGSRCTRRLPWRDRREHARDDHHPRGHHPHAKPALRPGSGRVPARNAEREARPSAKSSKAGCQLSPTRWPTHSLIGRTECGTGRRRSGGRSWPSRTQQAGSGRTARRACHHFVIEAGPHVSTGVRLLADLRTIYDRHHATRLATRALLADLTELEDAPWGDLDGEGKQLDGRRLAAELARYGVPRRSRSKTAATRP